MGEFKSASRVTFLSTTEDGLSVAAGLVGGVVGLIVGLEVRPATAWFAIFELAIPASIVGGLIGFASGAIAYVIGRKDTHATTGDVG